MNFANLEAEILTRLKKGERPTEDDLVSAALAACENDDERLQIEDEGVYGTVVSEDVDYALTFDWESWGAPNSSTGAMIIVRLDNRSFLCLPPDRLEGTHPFVVLGALEPDAAPDRAREVVRRLVAGYFDGEYSIRLPTSARNRRPDLLPDDAVKDAFRAAAHDEAIWEGLLDDFEELLEYRDEPINTKLPDADEGFDEETFERWFQAIYDSK